MWQLWIMLAEGEPTKQPGFSLDMVIFLFIVPLVLMYFLMIRPGQKRQEQ
jgi:preprotein translocase subunit YajC